MENIEIQPEPRFRGYSMEYFELINTEQTPPMVNVNIFIFL